ncbi:ABC transporter permease [Methanolobus bombayensis]|uniref:ABC transporter permease n=1 Tax=Methanolobus bombayensis TaxID=38023 RepID=UPI001AE34A02|nr:ABC transporter permease [Methanolobus bombayensis]MBP1910537.1 ABC-type Na+ efflux pump permease subunit [Methanolobus bombayensis]
MASWFTIAKWELMRSKLKFDARSIIMLIIALILVIVASYAASQTGMSMNQKIYLVASSQPEVQPIIETDQRFDHMLVDRFEASVYYEYGADMAIIGNNVYLSDTRKAASAGDALENTFIEYRELVLTSYNDVNNTHPVWVTVHDLERPQDFQLTGTEDTIDEISRGYNRTAALENVPGGKEGGSGDGSVRTGSSTISPEDIEALDAMEGKTFFERQTVSTPSNFNPPVPFTAILYAFLFIFPIYFVSQFYSTSLMDERTNRKGELVLIAPLRSRDVVIGKTLPYLVITMLIQAAITLYILKIPSTFADVERILLVLAAILPVILLFFALSFYSAILSRSFKELTFASVFLSVVISGYLFFPAMFANIHAISSISPITLIVRLIEGETVMWNTYIFSTLPFYLVAAAVYAFGTSIFREEDLFTQKSISSKIIDCFEMFLSYRYGSVFFLSIIFIPVVYMTQLMLIVMLFNLPVPYSILAMILLSALAEEIVKSIGIYTLFKRKITDITFKNAIRLSILAGAGFFVGEKAVAVLTLAPIASSAFGTVMTMGALLLIPLLLHITTVIINSLVMYWKGPNAYKYAVVAATIFHSIYNITILREMLL